MIEADFSIPNIRQIKVLNLNWLSEFVYRAFAVGYLARELEELTGLKEDTLRKLSNRFAEKQFRPNFIKTDWDKGGA